MIVLKTILGVFACFLLWVAADYGRTDECKIKLWSKDYWVIGLILLVSVIITVNIDKWFEE